MVECNIVFRSIQQIFLDKTGGSTCDAQVYILFEVATGFRCPLFLTNSWDGDSACFLSFVACDPEDNVVEINLAGKHLFGTISSSILQLTKLQILNFSNNHFYGQIPDGLSNLYDFSVLDISNNNFSGDVPTFVPNVLFNYSVRVGGEFFVVFFIFIRHGSKFLM
ncbi:hypothetical protein ACFE04_009061 [Oxalis oulophora]